MFDYAIVLNGQVADWQPLQLYLNKSRSLVAVDGGLNHLVRLGQKPRILLGDLDSASPASLDQAESWQLDKLRYSPEKDYTDSELAIRWCLNDYKIQQGESLEYTGKAKICLLAAFGNRYDHLLSNQFLCARFSKEADFLLSDGQRHQLILGNNSSAIRELDLTNLFQFISRPEKYVFSLLAMSDIVKRLTVKNAYYTLSDYDLKRGESLGVSNVFAHNHKGGGARISFAVGCLSVFLIPEE